MVSVSDTGTTRSSLGWCPCEPIVQAAGGLDYNKYDCQQQHHVLFVIGWHASELLGSWKQTKNTGGISRIVKYHSDNSNGNSHILTFLDFAILNICVDRPVQPWAGV